MVHNDCWDLYRYSFVKLMLKLMLSSIVTIMRTSRSAHTYTMSAATYTHTITLQILGADAGFFSKLVPSVVREMGGAFPELQAKEAFVTAIIAEEEQVRGIGLVATPVGVTSID